MAQQKLMMIISNFSKFLHKCPLFCHFPYNTAQFSGTGVRTSPLQAGAGDYDVVGVGMNGVPSEWAHALRCAAV